MALARRQCPLNLVGRCTSRQWLLLLLIAVAIPPQFVQSREVTTADPFRSTGASNHSENATSLPSTTEAPTTLTGPSNHSENATSLPSTTEAPTTVTGASNHSENATSLPSTTEAPTTLTEFPSTEPKSTTTTFIPPIYKRNVTAGDLSITLDAPLDFAITNSRIGEAFPDMVVTLRNGARLNALVLNKLCHIRGSLIIDIDGASLGYLSFCREVPAKSLMVELNIILRLRNATIDEIDLPNTNSISPFFDAPEYPPGIRIDAQDSNITTLRINSQNQRPDLNIYGPVLLRLERSAISHFTIMGLNMIMDHVDLNLMDRSSSLDNFELTSPAQFIVGGAVKLTLAATDLRRPGVDGLFINITGLWDTGHGFLVPSQSLVGINGRTLLSNQLPGGACGNHAFYDESEKSCHCLQPLSTSSCKSVQASSGVVFPGNMWKKGANCTAFYPAFDQATETTCPGIYIGNHIFLTQFFVYVMLDPLCVPVATSRMTMALWRNKKLYRPPPGPIWYKGRVPMTYILADLDSSHFTPSEWLEDLSPSVVQDSQVISPELECPNTTWKTRHMPHPIPVTFPSTAAPTTSVTSPASSQSGSFSTRASIQPSDLPVTHKPSAKADQSVLIEVAAITSSLTMLAVGALALFMFLRSRARKQRVRDEASVELLSDVELPPLKDDESENPPLHTSPRRDGPPALTTAEGRDPFHRPQSGELSSRWDDFSHDADADWADTANWRQPFVDDSPTPMNVSDEQLPEGHFAAIPASHFHELFQGLLREAALCEDSPRALGTLLSKLDVHAKDEDGRTLLMLAASEDRPALVVELLRRGLDVNETDSRQWTALFYAVTRANVSALQALLTSPQIRVNESDSLGRTALHWAAACGAVDCVVTLLEKDQVDPLAATAKKQTFLHLLAANEETEGVVKSIQRLAVFTASHLITAVDDDGETVVDVLQRLGHKDVASHIVHLVMAGNVKPTNS